MAQIAICRGDGPATRIELTKERIAIGRSRDEDIVLSDQWLSRRHAEVRFRDGEYYLQDLGSRNGTLLNGRRIEGEVQLVAGDVITLGEHRLVFDTAEAEGDSDGARAFPAREISDVTTLGDATVEEVRRTQLLKVLRRATQELVAHRPMPELYELTLDLLFEAVPAERGAVLLLEGDPRLPTLKASRSRAGRPIGSVSRSIARRVVEEGVALLLPNVLDDPNIGDAESVVLGGVRSALCAPLWFASGGEEQIVGLVYLDTYQLADAFDEEDLGVVTAIANLAAVKIHNARLFEEILEKRRLEEEMRLAAEMQSSLLPSEPPQVTGYTVSGSNEPCRTVGGDYFDYESRAGQVLFALGDVSGKGAAAAMLTTMLRASVRSWWGQDPFAAAVAQINRTVAENAPLGKYASCVLGRLDPSNGRTRYVNAGHNPPLLVKADGRVEQLDAGGTVLGLFDDAQYVEGFVVLSPGDSLVLYSDGITETTNPGDEEFGTLRLAEAARRHRQGDAPAIEAGILAQLAGFSGGARCSDDRTLLVIKRNS